MWMFYKLRLLSWSSPALHFFFLAAVTFGIVAPLACHHLLHSYFYARHRHLDQMSEEFLEQSLKEGEAALHYFEELQARNLSLPRGGPAPPRRPWLVITIVTVSRQPEFHYVLQVASGFHRLLQQCGPPCRSYQLFLCDVDGHSRHPDAALLANFIPATSRFASGPGLNASRAVFRNSFEKEKQDYAYCLEKSLQNYHPEYVLMVEDDAIPEEQIFSVLRHLLETSMGLVEVVGRHYLLELRRLAPALYNVVPTTQCCTPAMLFPASSAQRTVNYLAEISCRNGFAKDMALYSFLQDKNEKAYVVEPNLVRHIGLFSSLRLNYKPRLL
ncbi:post-GPI attachment to proteins factor 4 isoform X2 [Sminthopsis crassicaudata]|uniref:post-GPI attachment to proteins factor 4 isoform X2 n=1 Tax=Sminthopsis crassicaudata TaxID=9301 RepID=UPI003D69EF6D